jgi:WD40 repeat protein
MKAPSGVTQLMFNADSTMLFASCRQHSSIQCWDLRNPRTPVAAFKRETHTNQRMMFDLDSEGQFLVTGDQTGDVCIFDLKSDEAVASTPQEPMPPSKAFRACGDSVNGVSLHPSLAVLATGSGKRNFTSSMAIDSSDEDSNDEESADEMSDCSLKFWSVGPP